MSIYYLKSPQSPWGDYGDILISGMTNRLTRQNGLLQLERTGPFVPPIFFPGINEIVVTDNFRKLLEKSGLTDMTFQPVIKKRIVLLNWEKWDKSLSEPREYPTTGNPEDYILEKAHSCDISDNMGELWELILYEHGEFKPYLGLTAWDSSDLFRVRNIAYNFVSQRAKNWLEQFIGEWVNFKEVSLEEKR